MNAIEHLTIKLAETSLMQEHPSVKDYDELRALLIAARTEAPEANDPPDWPDPTSDADHAARLDRMQRDSNVLAYAEKLRHALSNQGHSLTLAAAITVAKAMLQPAATAAAPAVGLEPAREDSLRTAAWEPSDAEVRECAAVSYSADNNVSVETARTRLPAWNPTHPVYRRGRAALRYARELFGAEADRLRERLRETERCWNLAVEKVAKQAARIAELEAPKPSEPTEDDLATMTSALSVAVQKHAWGRNVAQTAYRIAAQRRPVAPLPAVPAELLERLPSIETIEFWLRVAEEGPEVQIYPPEMRALRDLLVFLLATPNSLTESVSKESLRTADSKPAQAMPELRNLMPVIADAYTLDTGAYLATATTEAIARAILSTAQPTSLPGTSPDDVQDAFYEGVRGGCEEALSWRSTPSGQPVDPTSRKQLWEASDARARLAVIPGAEGLGQREKAMPTELAKYLEQWRAGQMSGDQAERILTMVANWAAST